MIDTLISQITSQLGVSEEQASGGAGALFAMAKDKLGGDFSQIADGIPSLDDLISKAPSSEGGGGGLLGAASGLLGGGKLGNLAELAGTFKSLGLDGDQIGGFGEIIINFIKDKLGDQAAGLLGGLLK